MNALLNRLMTGTNLDAGEKYVQRCRSCGQEHAGFSTKCRKCNGAIDVFYDLSRVQLKKSENTYRRYFDILPVKDEKNLKWLGDGGTPLIHSKKIGKKLGLKNLYLKYEGANPTNSTKDRMATVSLSYLFENGIFEFALSSTGNTGTSYAYGVTKYPEFKMHLIYHGSPRRLNFRLRDNIRTYKISGDFVKACSVANSFAVANKITAEGGFFNPGRREGLKMAFAEAAEQMKTSPDWYFQATSSSMGVVGTHKAACELRELGLVDKIPKLGCIQQDTCNPMVLAWRENSESIKQHHLFENPRGIAKAILRGNPVNTYPIIRELVIDTGGKMESVNRTAIIRAMHMLREENLACCPASGVALAGLVKMRQAGEIDADEVVMVNLTGGIRPKTVYPRQFIPL